MSDPAAMSGSSAAMHIGEVAARTSLSLRSLRHWDEVGLLHPSGRTDGGFRLYQESDVEKILVIRRMKPLGFTLEQMKGVLVDTETLCDPAADGEARRTARERVDAIRTEAIERRAALARQLDMADEFLELITREVAPD
ncbi:MerR family transcriptional regulator [Nocardioides sp. 503]|uniref:helix-turn-helix domain-containing protein n=1 Tax=Nocardioides sp. 503 TaxID=2508326 RepID=UPI001ADA21F5|nr:MerR family transcriptional regulator [Nocardioides sp. 503]